MSLGQICTILVLFLIVICPSAKKSYADTEGISGKLVGVQIVDQGSDTFSKFRGSIFIYEGQGVVQEYKWGGSTCTGIVSIIDSDIANFSRILTFRSFIRIIPIYKNGQGGSRCIKRYILVNRFFLDNIEYIVD